MVNCSFIAQNVSYPETTIQINYGDNTFDNCKNYFFKLIYKILFKFNESSN